MQWILTEPDAAEALGGAQPRENLEWPGSTETMASFKDDHENNEALPCDEVSLTFDYVSRENSTGTKKSTCLYCYSVTSAFTLYTWVVVDGDCQ